MSGSFRTPTEDSLFEKLARKCALRPWSVIITWVTLFAIGATLFATIFNKNMTTITEFTTATNSKRADDLFKERFPKAAYKVENAVITSNIYTADDPEFWAYVDGLYEKLRPLRDSGVVKDVQYYDPVLREGLPLMPPFLQQMVDAMRLALQNDTTSEDLIRTAAELRASAAELSKVISALPEDMYLTATGVKAKEGMLQAVDGAEELGGSLLLSDALRKLRDALALLAIGIVPDPEVFRDTIEDLQNTAPLLRNAAQDLQECGPGTPARVVLISGLRQIANGLEEVAGLYWLRYGLTLTNNALKPIADDQVIPIDTLLSTVQSLRDLALELRAAANELEKTGPGTPEERPKLITGLRDTANGLEEVAGLYWLRYGLTLTNNALKPIADGQVIPIDSLRTTVQSLRDLALELRAAANELEKTGPGTPEERPKLITGLRDTANGLEEVAGLYWLRHGLTLTYNALVPMAAGTPLTDDELNTTTTLLWDTAPELRAAADELEETGPGTPGERPKLIAGLRETASGLEEIAGLYELKNCVQKGLEFAQMLTPSPLPTAEQIGAGVDQMYITLERLRQTIDRLNATGPGTPARPELIDGLTQAADELEAYIPQAEMLRAIANIPWLLWLALVIMQPTIQDQIATAQAGLAEIQQQCSDNIGQVQDGLIELRVQCAYNAGLTTAGLDQIQQQCSDNLDLTADGLAQIQQQCSEQIAVAKAGLMQIQSQLSDQLPTAIAGVDEAISGNIQAAGLVSADKRTTLFAISMSEDADEAASHILELRKYVLTGNGIGLEEDSFENGFRVRMVGNSNVSQDMQDVALSDLKVSLSYAIPIALIILIIVFGTLAAAALPLVLSIISIIIALGIAAVIGIWMPLTFAVQNIVFMLGLALGIDHALFVAYRYREERRKGRDKIDAIAKAGATAGHGIFYAGFIVVIALFGIYMIPCNMHKSLALGAIIVVAVIAAASLTLLPAVLSLLGNRFDWGRLPWQKRITEIEQPQTEETRGFWHWVTRPAMRAPVISLLVCIGVLAACIIPMTDMRLNYSYVDTLPKGCVSRSGFDAMMEAGYPSFLVAPLDIAIEGYDKPEVKAATADLIQRLEDDGGFVTAVPLEVNDKGDVAWKRIFLNQDPFTPEASQKVTQLRTEFIGDNFKAAGGNAYVTGYGAFNNDFVSVTERYMPPVLAFVLGLSFLLVMVVFRSILFALACTIFNLLSVFAAYGLVVFVFQEGHSGGFYQTVQGIDAYVPIFLLCGLIGISMDYFLFMLSRIRERYDETEDVSDAIMQAFRRTGFVVLGAAAVMLVIFFAFSISQIVIVAELGFGLCVAILIDATLITLVMSPAAMKLLGRWFWWWPSWLNWVPDLRVKRVHV